LIESHPLRENIGFWRLTRIGSRVVRAMEELRLGFPD